MRGVIVLVLLAACPATAVGQGSARQTLTSGDAARKTDVLGAFTDSLQLLLIEHGTRLATESRTRQAMGGNFLADYRRSVRIPDQWGDTDGWLVNYVGHPIHGAAAGYIWLDHEARAPVTFSLDSTYWSSRTRAMAWAAGYSLQFEIGLVSEAAIGNVGMRPETTGWVDHVITPIGAFGWIVAEDALDRYLVERLEGKIQNRVVRAIIRLGMNPGRTLSNTASGRMPWFRDDRPLTAR